MKFIETSHIKDMVAYMKILFNPRDAISWQRVLLLISGIGPKKASSVINLVTEGKIKFSKKSDLSDLNLPESIKELIGKINKMYNSNASISDKCAIFAEYYRPLLKQKHDDWKKRWEDIETFITIAERYNSMQSFLNDLALDPPTESLSELEPESNDNEIMTLSTIHSAKGLEWQAVFIIWALEGRFPSAKSVQTVDNIEEERRLFYVACTRAKQYLFISYPTNIYDRESGFVLSEPSRYIKDIPESIAERFVISYENDNETNYSKN